MKPFWLVVAALLLAAAWRLRMLGRVGRVIALLVAVGAALVGFGAVHLPSVETIVSDVGSELGNWAYPLVGVNAFLETGAFLGFIAPGETMVLFGGVLAGNGTIELVPLILVVWGSCILGDLTSYAIGRRYGRDFLLKHGARIKVGEPQIQFVERFFERRGTLTLFVGRWVGVVRPLLPFLAGSTRLPFARFALIDFVSTGLWSTALCVLGSVFWKNFDELTSLVGRFLFIFGTIVVVVGAIAFGISAWRSERRRAAVDAWIASRLEHRRFLGRPAAGAWAFIGWLARLLPGDGAPSQAAAGVGTVPGNGEALGPPDSEDHPAH